MQRSYLRTWRRLFSNSPTIPRPTEALEAFYGEKFTLTTTEKTSEIPISQTKEVVYTRILSSNHPTVDSILGTIRDACDAQVAHYIFTPQQAGVLGKAQHHLILDLESSRERLYVANLLSNQFAMERKEGMKRHLRGEWIILEMEMVSCVIHIFDPMIRQKFDLDEQLQAQQRELLDESIV